MSDLKMECPGCHWWTSDIGIAARNNEPCPNCGFKLENPIDAIIAIAAEDAADDAADRTESAAHKKQRPTTNNRGWFAHFERPDDDDPWPGYTPEDPWYAAIQTESGVFPLGGTWFSSKEDCEWFIREHLISQGWLTIPGASE